MRNDEWSDKDLKNENEEKDMSLVQNDVGNGG